MKISDVIKALESVAPFGSACDWDNSTLNCGDENANVTCAIVTLDADKDALDHAKSRDCQLVISHHPLVFSPVKQVLAPSMLYEYIKSGISVLCAHTNLDMAVGGINDLLANAAGIENPKPFMLDGYPLGRYGSVGTHDFLEFIDNLKSKLNLDTAQYIQYRKIDTVAVVSGSGGSAVYELSQYGCDTLVTGEAKHEHYVYACNNGLNLITLGHFETENIIIKPLCEKLSQLLPQIEFIPSDKTGFVKRR